MKLNLPSPIQKITVNKTFGEIYVKRDDLIHPLISGNKWRKLKSLVSNFEGNTLITYGGAFSNHLVAVAGYAFSKGLKSKAFIRGEELNAKNPTLSLCLRLGMKLEFLDRESYRNQTNEFNSVNGKTDGEDLYIPEGGTTEHVKVGMKDLISEIKSQIQNNLPLKIFCSYGTGGTAIGIGHNLEELDSLEIIPAIKGLTREKILENAKKHNCNLKNYRLLHYPEMKRYAAKDLHLFQFCENFLLEKKILLDPIYTSKVMYYLDKYEVNNPDINTVFIHSGGLQAWNGYFYRFPELKEKLPAIFQEINEHEFNI